MTDPNGWDPGTRDLTSCDKEAIHIPGSIQPHGMLLAVELPDLTIAHVSSNCEQWLEQPPCQLIDRSLDSLLDHDSRVVLRTCLPESTEITSSLRSLRFAWENRAPVTFSASVHRSGNNVIIELERPLTEAGPTALTLMGQLRVANCRLSECQSVVELCDVVTRELRSLTGYDRILIYEFDKDWNGAVIAEQRAESLDSYLGLHYPASDIPAPARAMFLVNGLRVIPDAQYQPVPLHPATDPRTGLPLDLSRAQLRSASPIHREYLQNMGVQASLTISMIVDGKLWGLIACHHRSPRLPSHEVREFCELFGQIVSVQLTRQVHAASMKVAEQGKAVLRRFAQRFHQSDSLFPPLLTDSQDLLTLANAQGVVFWRDGEALPFGVTPTREAIANVQKWVAEATKEPIFVTDCLPKRFPDAGAFAEVASGLLVLALARDPDVYILWFRPEVIQTVDWAGDPSKSISSTSNDGRLHPRRSFALWKESVRHCSLPWLDGEIEAVRQLGSMLQERLARTAERLRKLLPICAWCRKVRSDQDYWQQVEEYVVQHTDIRFTHGMCPDCLSREMANVQRTLGIR